MHPLLIGTYVLNLILITGVWGVLGFFGVIGTSAGAYYFVSTRGGDRFKIYGQLAAIGIVHALGILAVYAAKWSTPTLVGVAFIMETFVFAIFSAFGKN